MVPIKPNLKVVFYGVEGNYDVLRKFLGFWFLIKHGNLVFHPNDEFYLVYEGEYFHTHVERILQCLRRSAIHRDLIIKNYDY